jgi:hypothetical protein
VSLVGVVLAIKFASEYRHFPWRNDGEPHLFSIVLREKEGNIIPNVDGFLEFAGYRQNTSAFSGRNRSGG